MYQLGTGRGTCKPRAMRTLILMASSVCFMACQETEGGSASSGGSSGLPGSSTSAASQGSSTDGPNSAAECPAVQSVEEQPAVRVVTFKVENTGTEPLFLAQAGEGCDPFSVHREDGSRVLQNVGFDCGCTCALPYAPTTRRWLWVAAGESEELAWDGRQLMPYDTYRDCRGPFTSLGACEPIITGSHQPVGPGTYRMSVLVRPGLANPLGSAQCHEDATGVFCTSSSQRITDPSDMPPVVQESCAHAEAVAISAEFVLPAGAENVTVNIPVNLANVDAGTP